MLNEKICQVQDNVDIALGITPYFITGNNDLNRSTLVFFFQFSKRHFFRKSVFEILFFISCMILAGKERFSENRLLDNIGK